MENDTTKIPLEHQNVSELEKPDKKPQNTYSVFVIIFLIVLGLSNFGTYFWQKSIVDQKEKQIDELNSELTQTKNELELIKNPPIPPYCEKGEKYVNTPLKYRVCLQGNLVKDPEETGGEDHFFLGTHATGNSIFIKTSTDYIENALNKYTKDVFVDDVDRYYKVEGIAAIQVSGSVKPGRKRAITVFTKDAVTYEISLENAEDATYTENLDIYKEFVESFTFLDSN